MQLHAIQKKHFELLNQPLIGIGSFASVYEYDATTVLKVTSCDVTQKLFKAAVTSPKTWPEGLPEVKKILGAIARDDDGVIYHGYLLEKLFTIESWVEESRGARAVMHRKSIRETGKKSLLTQGAEAAQLLEVQRLARLHQPDPDVAPAQAQAGFALEMASLVAEPLSSGFLYLAEFMADGGVAFDLATPDNLRLDCFGRVKLCDPASYAGEQSAEDVPGCYVLCDIPIALHKGTETTLKAMSMRARDQDQALAIASRLRSMQLEPHFETRLLNARAYVARGTTVRQSFRYLDIKYNLEDDAYRKTLFADKYVAEALPCVVSR